MTVRPAQLRVDLADATSLLGACAAPSEAFWRLLELDVVRRCATQFRQPVLEVGCGDGTFTRLTGIPVQVGTDRELRAVARARESGVYERVLRLDIHDVDPAKIGQFGTIYANSVLEHVPSLEAAFPILRAALEPNGRLVATVPLAEMNNQLAWSSSRYTSWRQRQLEHRNLWSKRDWDTKLGAAGFAAVQWTDYLPGEACRFWDRADTVATLGSGRFRVGPALHRAATWGLPGWAKDRIKLELGRLLLGRAASLSGGPPCAALLCAANRE